MYDMFNEGKVRKPFDERAQRYIDHYQPTDMTVPVHPSEFEQVFTKFRGLYIDWNTGLSYRLRLMGS